MRKPQRNILRLLVVAALAIAFFHMPAVSQAQKKGKGGVIRLEETVIEGRVQKPNAFFINTRQGLVYQVMELRESFVSEISKVVDDGEF